MYTCALNLLLFFKSQITQQSETPVKLERGTVESEVAVDQVKLRMEKHNIKTVDRHFNDLD